MNTDNREQFDITDHFISPYYLEGLVSGGCQDLSEESTRHLSVWWDATNIHGCVFKHSPELHDAICEIDRVPTQCVKLERLIERKS